MVQTLYLWLKKRQKPIEGLWLPLSAIFANAIIAVTLVLGFASYYQAKGLGQVEASLGYVDTFNGGEVLQARNLIYRSWLPYDFSTSNTALSRGVIDALLERIVADVSTSEGVDHRLAVAVIVAFFDSVQACVSEGACSDTVLRSQVGEYGRDFYCLYKPIIERERARGKLVSFGSGLETVADKAGGC